MTIFETIIEDGAEYINWKVPIRLLNRTNMTNMTCVEDFSRTLFTEKSPKPPNPVDKIIVNIGSEKLPDITTQGIE